MRSRTTANRGMSPALVMLIVIGVLLVGGFGTAATLIATGTIDLASLPWFKQIAADPNAGKIPVIVAGRPIAMYAKVASEHLTDPTTNKYSVTHFDPQQVQPDWIRSYDQILGRVLKRDKTPGKVFTERDFFPEGTAPGRVAGIPPGMLGISLDPSKIKGLTALSVGDRFDVLANVSKQPTTGPGQKRAGFHSRSPRGAHPPGGMVESTSEVQALVHNGLVVQLAGSDAMIAVDPGESLALTKALASETALYCMARSGHPAGEAAVDQLVPTKPESMVKSWTVEVIKNQQREYQTFDAQDNFISASSDRPQP